MQAPVWRNAGRRRDRGGFERLVDADRLGILRYTRHLTLRPTEDGFHEPRSYPRDLQEYLPQLRSIIQLDSLTLDSFYLPHFTPVFNNFFGIFANTLRHLDIRSAYGTVQQLLYFVCRFPRLEDLTVVSPATLPSTHAPIPTITQSPPFRGKLVLANVRSAGLAAFPTSTHWNWPRVTRKPSLRRVAALRPRYLTYGNRNAAVSQIPLFRCGLRCNRWEL